MSPLESGGKRVAIVHHTNRIRYRFTPAHCSPKLHTDLKGDYGRSECGEKEYKKKLFDTQFI